MDVPGCGRPFWIDDPGVDIGDHVRPIACAAPGDEQALLAVSADAIGGLLFSLIR